MGRAQGKGKGYLFSTLQPDVHSTKRQDPKSMDDDAQSSTVPQTLTVGFQHPSVVTVSIASKCTAIQALSAEEQRTRKLSSAKRLPLDLLFNVTGTDCGVLGNRGTISKNSVGFGISSLQTNLVYVKPKG